MPLDPDTCWRALVSHDARFDGRFFVGVTSTGIYCRTVCTSRGPKREHCTWHPSAAAAESAGFRPCLRCRPELAPGHAAIDATSRLAQAAARHIEDGALDDGLSIEALADALGITSRHLRRVFDAEFGVSPIAYAQTQRLLLAKRLLTDTAMPITEVAYAAGFGSFRRFHALFTERYRLRPSDLRKRTAPVRADATLAFQLGFRAPFDWAALLDFLGGRAIDGVEHVDAAHGEYRRTVRMTARDTVHVGWIAVTRAAARDAVQVVLSASLAHAIAPTLARVKRLLDLQADPHEIATVLGSLAANAPGLRLPGAFDGFEMAVRAILGQQITVKAARTLAGRFAQRFGDPIAHAPDGLRVVFPTAATVAAADVDAIASLGIIAARARSILALAAACAEGRLRLEPSADPDAQLATLRALPGIGDWTAQYLGMRALGLPDAFPVTDYGVRKALGTQRDADVIAHADAWRPWRAYAVMHLWRRLAAPTPALAAPEEITA
jgi:AraC family transcriptional regulator of adaptative response / DNA-3-methyladenine glycosylase II